MRNTFILFITLIIIHSCSTLKQKKECEKVLDNELYFSKNSKKIEFDKDYKILQNCGKLDSIDKLIFTPQIIGTLMISQIPKNDKLTYRVILKKINEIRNSQEYPIQKEKIYLSNKIKNKIVNENDWEEDKIILKKIGLEGKQLNEFKNFISKFKNTNTTYETAFNQFEKYRNKNVKKKTSFKFQVFSEYNQILQEAKTKNKYILLFFKAYSGINCLKMESDILTDEKIKSHIKKNFLAFELIVDSRKKLKEKYFSEKIGKEISTIGMKSAVFEIEKFNSKKQPYFVIVDKNGNVIKKQEYTKSITEFMNFITLKN